MVHNAVGYGYKLSGVCCVCFRRAQLVHLYRFKGDLNDSIGSLAIIDDSGTFGSSSLTFAANQGPSLTECGASLSRELLDWDAPVAGLRSMDGANWLTIKV